MIFLLLTLVGLIIIGLINFYEQQQDKRERQNHMRCKQMTDRLREFSLIVIFASMLAGCQGGAPAPPSGNPPPPPPPPSNVAPKIVTPPANAVVTAGSAASFVVTATGTAQLHYAWSIAGTPAGMDEPTFTTGPLTVAQSGSAIGVQVSNDAGQAVAQAAVTVMPASNGITPPNPVLAVPPVSFPAPSCSGGPPPCVAQQTYAINLPPIPAGSLYLCFYLNAQAAQLVALESSNPVTDSLNDSFHMIANTDPNNPDVDDDAAFCFSGNTAGGSNIVATIDVGFSNAGLFGATAFVVTGIQNIVDVSLPAAGADANNGALVVEDLGSMAPNVGGELVLSLIATGGGVTPLPGVGFTTLWKPVFPGSETPVLLQYQIAPQSGSVDVQFGAESNTMDAFVSDSVGIY